MGDEYGFREQLKSYDVNQLIERFNKEVGNTGWVSARGHFLAALRDALLATGLDCSDFIGEHEMSLKYPIRIHGDRITQIKTGEVENLKERMRNVERTASSRSLVSFETMERFARNVLGADSFPNDLYRLSLYECLKCGGPTPLILTIEHYTGSAERDFRGRILARCGACDESREALSKKGEALNPTTGRLEPDKPERQEHPRCECGNVAFAVASCLHFEPDGGPPPGFFDDGVVVGQCPQCGKCRVFVGLD